MAVAKRSKASSSTRKPVGDSRARIVAAAIREFGRNGFTSASTNTISVDAGVAKGLLFHHFGSKEALFTAAFHEVAERAAASILRDDPPLPTDLFERLAAISMRKLAFFQEDPDAYNVAWTTVTSLPEPLRTTLIEQERTRLGARWAVILDGVDTSKLRKGITVDQAAETITLLLEGLERPMMQAIRDAKGPSHRILPRLQERALMHLNRLRDGLYR